MKKKTAKNKTEKTFRPGEVMVLFEEIRDNFRAFGDNQKLLTDKVDKLTEKVDGMDVRLSGVEDKIGMNSLRLITVENGIKTLKRDNKDSFKSLLEYLYRIEQEIQLMKTVVSKKADREKLINLEKRLIKTEKLVLAKLAG